MFATPCELCDKRQKHSRNPPMETHFLESKYIDKRSQIRRHESYVMSAIGSISFVT